jgi:trk system potassium uptake protein
VAMRAYRGGPLVQHPLKDLKQHMPNIDVRVPAIFRQGKPLIPTGDTVVQPGDEVFCLAPSTHIREVMAELRRMDKPVKRIMIAGGGNIGMRFAQAIEKDYDVKIIEWSKKRGEVLAQELDRALVLNGDSTDEDLLYNEHVEECDMFLALTNDDENNIMSALLAKRMGARRVVALINRKAYADLMQGGQIDIAISPAQVTIGSLLQHIRQGDVVAVHSLRRGAAEAIEVIAHGDRSGSKVIGRAIRDIELPKGASIAALTRKGQAYVAHDEMVIEPDDHLIVFVGNKKMVPKVEKLFTVSAGFF